MTFTETFGGFVCEGDAIHCEKDGYHVTARIFRRAADVLGEGAGRRAERDAPSIVSAAEGGAMLCYAMLCCAVLCCAVLCYARSPPQ